MRPVQLLELERSVDDAAVTVIDPPLLRVVPLMVPRVPERRLVPMDEVAITFPVASVERSAEASDERYAEPETVRAVDDAYVVSRLVAQPRVMVARVLVEFENWLRPVHELLFARSVEEAAVIVMSDVPLNDVPLMFRAVWRAVAVPALPPIESEEVEIF